MSTQQGTAQPKKQTRGKKKRRRYLHAKYSY